MATYKAKSLVMPNGDEFVQEENVFVAEYGVTTWAEVNAAYQAGKVMYCQRDMGGWTQQLAFRNFDGDGNGFEFTAEKYDGSELYVAYIYEGYSWDNATRKAHAYPYTSVSPSSTQYISVSTATGTLNRSTVQFGNSTTKYLSNKGTWENVPTVPSNVSSFNNDAGYLTLSTLPIWDGSVT